MVKETIGRKVSGISFRDAIRRWNAKSSIADQRKENAPVRSFPDDTWFENPARGDVQGIDTPDSSKQLTQLANERKT